MSGRWIIYQLDKMTKSKLLREWETARDDLGIEIIAPYEVDLGNNVKIRAEILVRNFGGRNGTLIFTNSDVFWPCRDQLCNLGYGYSVLEEPKETYDREIFIEMLSEWEWDGDEAKKPIWLMHSV